jgi:hypothetical protein
MVKTGVIVEISRSRQEEAAPGIAVPTYRKEIH